MLQSIPPQQANDGVCPCPTCQAQPGAAACFMAVSKVPLTGHVATGTGQSMCVGVGVGGEVQ